MTMAMAMGLWTGNICSLIVVMSMTQCTMQQQCQLILWLHLTNALSPSLPLIRNFPWICYSLFFTGFFIFIISMAEMIFRTVNKFTINLPALPSTHLYYVVSRLFLCVLYVLQRLISFTHTNDTPLLHHQCAVNLTKKWATTTVDIATISILQSSSVVCASVARANRDVSLQDKYWWSRHKSPPVTANIFFSSFIWNGKSKCHWCNNNNSKMQCEMSQWPASLRNRSTENGEITVLSMNNFYFILLLMPLLRLLL